jgi:hypothetical protein
MPNEKNAFINVTCEKQLTKGCESVKFFDTLIRIYVLHASDYSFSHARR